MLQVPGQRAKRIFNSFEPPPQIDGGEPGVGAEMALKRGTSQRVRVPPSKTTRQPVVLLFLHEPSSLLGEKMVIKM